MAIPTPLSELALGSHLVQWQGQALREPPASASTWQDSLGACTHGPFKKHINCLALPKPLPVLHSPQDSVQILGLHPRPHTLPVSSLPVTQAMFYHISGPLPLLCPLPGVPSSAPSVQVLFQCHLLPGSLP